MSTFYCQKCRVGTAGVPIPESKTDERECPTCHGPLKKLAKRSSTLGFGSGGNLSLPNHPVSKP